MHSCGQGRSQENQCAPDGSHGQQAILLWVNDTAQRSVICDKRVLMQISEGGGKEGKMGKDGQKILKYTKLKFLP